jgi:hypothetical protein
VRDSALLREAPGMTIVKILFVDRVVNLVPLQEQRPLTPWEGVNFLLMFPAIRAWLPGDGRTVPGVAPPAAP